MVHARVRPELKYAGEQILRRMGLSLTDAMELFLWRLIVDQKLPFEVTAVDGATRERVLELWKEHQEKAIDFGGNRSKKSRLKERRE